jgi:hypothetical protein
VLGPAKHDATPGATALLEAAAALADAQAAAAGPATGATCALAQSVSKSAGQAQAGEAAGLEQLPTAMASNGPVCLQQQQFMTTVGTAGPAAAVASKDALCSQGDTAVVGAGAGSGQSSPPPAPHSSRGAAQGSLMRSSSPALQEPPAVPFLRSVSASSAWEVAVRQGSTLALAPGHRLAPSSAAAAAATMAGQGVGGSLGDDARSTAGVALPARTQSTTEPSAAAAAAAGHMPPPLRAGQRSVSWAGASFAEQPFLGRSSEQGAAAGKHPALDAAAPAGAFSCGKVPLGALDCLAEGIAEGMELSVTSSHMLGQVQSLLSPLQSNDIAAADARVLTPVAGTAAAGDTVGAAAADALAAGSAAQPAAAVGGGGASAAATSRAPALLTGAYQHQHQQALAAGAAQAALAVGAAEGLAAQLQDAAVAGAAAAEGALEVASAVMSDGQLVPLELLEEALHWHAYANAIYGWPMFLWSHRYRWVAGTRGRAGLYRLQCFWWC